MKNSLVFLCSLVVFGCHQEFSPNGPYEQRLVVYAVFAVGTDTQFVDVYSTIDPSQYAPSGPLQFHEVVGATVTVAVDDTHYVFRDTTTIVSVNGIAVPVKKYVHTGLNIVPNKSYAVTVVKAGFPTASAQFTAFAQGSILPVNTQLFVNANVEKDLELNLFFAKGAYAYLLRLLLEYEKKIDGVWKPMKQEVPVYYSGTVPHFPQIDFVTPSGTVRKVYTHSVYRATIHTMRSVPSDTIRFTNAVIELQQFDRPLYSYYSIVNSFPGGASIRLDEPDFTNVENGYGVVGVVSRYEYRTAIPAYP